jgi:tetratricopeptide (TPR) repeat protein
MPEAAAKHSKKVLSSRGQTSSRPASAPGSTKKKAGSAAKKKAKPARKKTAEGGVGFEEAEVEEGLEDVAEGEEGAEEVVAAGVSGLTVGSGSGSGQSAEADEAEELARVARDKGRLDEAERQYRRVLELRRSALGDRHPLTISTIDALGAVLYMEADLDGAETLLLEALAARRETLGERHPDTIASISNSGMCA